LPDPDLDALYGFGFYKSGTMKDDNGIWDCLQFTDTDKLPEKPKEISH
jgi:hypothetical protein